MEGTRTAQHHTSTETGTGEAGTGATSLEASTRETHRSCQPTETGAGEAGTGVTSLETGTRETYCSGWSTKQRCQPATSALASASFRLAAQPASAAWTWTNQRTQQPPNHTASVCRIHSDGYSTPFEKFPHSSKYDISNFQDFMVKN